MTTPRTITLALLVAAALRVALETAPMWAAYTWSPRPVSYLSSDSSAWRGRDDGIATTAALADGGARRRSVAATPQDRHRNAIVTFGSDTFFDALLNIIGSARVWAPGVPVVVYDLSLSPRNAATLCCLINVQLVPFNWTREPPHVQQLYNYAFKPLVMKDAVQRGIAENLLFLDAGIELRGDVSGVFDVISTAGFFFVESDRCAHSRLPM